MNYNHLIQEGKWAHLPKHWPARANRIFPITGSLQVGESSHRWQLPSWGLEVRMAVAKSSTWSQERAYIDVASVRTTGRSCVPEGHTYAPKSFNFRGARQINDKIKINPIQKWSRASIERPKSSGQIQWPIESTGLDHWWCRTAMIVVVAQEGCWIRSDIMDHSQRDITWKEDW